MPINSSGKISFTDIAAEHGGQKPYSASAYLRGGALVTGTPSANAEIPATASDIQFSDYYGSKSTIQITYEIQGGGGAGGGGYNDRGDNSGTANNGGDSSITYGVTTITATGGGGGEHGGNGREQPGTAGESSHYGAGGAGGAKNTAGSSAAASSYGAAGGGGGGGKWLSANFNPYRRQGGYGGGVSLYGEGTSGAGGIYDSQAPNYDDNMGGPGSHNKGTDSGQDDQEYGGGAPSPGGANAINGGLSGDSGKQGAVRIVWPGRARRYPSQNVAQ